MSPGEDSRPPRGSVIDLTRESDFRIGGADVRPSRSEVAPLGPAIRLQPRVMQVLVALARADGEVVSRDVLVAQCWGSVVVGEDALNRCIGRLRKLSEETGQAFTIETLPRLGYRLIGKVVAQSHPATAAAPSRVTRLQPTVGGLVAIAAIAMVAALAAILVWRQVEGRPARPLIALAPFTTSGDDPAARLLASRLQAEVSDVAQASGLGAVVFATAGPASDRSFGRARFVLDGRVYSEAGNLKTQVQLTDRRDARVLWAGRFQRPRSEATWLTTQTAAKVTDVLNCAFGTEHPKRSDTDSLALFLQACDLGHDYSRQDQERDILRKIVAREPRFPAALGMLAVADATAAELLPTDEARLAQREARESARRALTLDRSEPNAYIALAILEDETAQGHIRSESWFRNGLRGAPDSAELNTWQSDLMLKMGYVDDAVRFAQRGNHLDPLSPAKAKSLADALTARGDWSQGRAILQQAAVQWPADFGLAQSRLDLEISAGDTRAALALLANPADRPPEWNEPRLQRLQAALKVRLERAPANRTAALAEQELDLLRSGAIGPSSAMELMLVLGRTDDAFAAAYIGPPEHLATELLFQPLAAPMRRDRRFPALATRLGLVKFWRAERRWPDFCRDPALPYDCRKL